MIPKSLDWDSKFFDLRVASIEIGPDHSIKDIELENYDFVYVHSQKALEETIEGLKWMETKRSYELNLKGEGEEVELSDHLFNVDNLTEDLLELAILSGSYSRYNRDSNVPTHKFKEMYRIWIDKSLKKNSVLVYRLNHVIAGFVSYSIFDKIGKIELIAVSPDYQNQGIGSKLINYLHSKVYRENNLEKAQVVTQAENKFACALYEKHQYKVLKDDYLYHYWKQR